MQQTLSSVTVLGAGVGGGFAELLGVRSNAAVVAWNSPGVHSVLRNKVNMFVKHVH